MLIERFDTELFGIDNLFISNEFLLGGTWGTLLNFLSVSTVRYFASCDYAVVTTPMDMFPAGSVADINDAMFKTNGPNGDKP